MSFQCYISTYEYIWEKKYFPLQNVKWVHKMVPKYTKCEKNPVSPQCDRHDQYVFYLVVVKNANRLNPATLCVCPNPGPGFPMLYNINSLYPFMPTLERLKAVGCLGLGPIRTRMGRIPWMARTYLKVPPIFHIFSS